MGSGVSRVQAVSVTGTGADLEVRTIEFRPRAVRVINESGDEITWTETMADDTGLKRKGADGIASFLATLGITPLSDGIKIGADTDINVDGELLHIIAWE